MTKKPPDELTEKEARRRFEAAVDAALHTAPMHRESKADKKKSAHKKKAKG